MNHKFITSLLLFLLLLQSSSMIHMNYEVNLDTDELENSPLYMSSGLQRENTKIKYTMNSYSKTNINLKKTLITVIIKEINSILLFNSMDKFNYQPVLVFRFISLFTLLSKFISLKNDIYNIISIFFSYSFLTLREEYNSVIFYQPIFFVFYLNDFSNMVRLYYFAKN